MKKLSYKLFFKAFSNKTRFEIISFLRKGPKSVNEISKRLNFEQSRVSHNLKCLVGCGFLNSKRKGKEIFYSLDEEYILPIFNNIEKHVSVYNKRLEKCGILKGKNYCGVKNE